MKEPLKLRYPTILEIIEGVYSILDEFIEKKAKKYDDRLKKQIK